MRITVYCNPAIDDGWSPASVASGIGGSEEAVIHMSAGLAARGHAVTVVHRAAGPVHRHDGVCWTSYAALPKPRADIGIIWRRAGLVDRIDRASAQLFYLWMHDLRSEADILPRLDVYDRVMVLSRFHRNWYPSLRREKVFLTANGIAPQAFADCASQVTPRDPHLMVYGSCYSRGLRTLLTLWPRIRDAVPTAKLNVFYGWQSMRAMRPARYHAIHDIFETLMGQQGITHLGKLSHAEVARQYESAGIWAYPCSFPETSCISAMKAQAAGAVPVVIPTGALSETVRHGFKTMRSHSDYVGQLFPRRIMEEWFTALVELLRSPERQSRIRAEMMPDSRRRFAWSAIVDGWEREFATRLNGAAVNVPRGATRGLA